MRTRNEPSPNRTPGRYPLLVRRSVRILAASTALTLAAAPSAFAGDPMVIPTAGTGLAPPELFERSLDYPNGGSGLNFPKQYAAIKVAAPIDQPQETGYITIGGLTGAPTNSMPVVWDDVGSGKPASQAPGSRWLFRLPGKYSYHCQCVLGIRGEGDVYVVGPRPRVTALNLSPDNTPPVSYQLDASTSSVTDWTPFDIVRYDFDLNADNVYGTTAPDQSGPEPFAPISFPQPGEHNIGLRVWDNYPDRGATTLGRFQEYILTVIVPKQRAVTPPPPPVIDLPPRTRLGPGEVIVPAKISLKTRSKISLSLLRKNGLSIKVSGLLSGDTVSAALTKGAKRRKFASKSGRATSGAITLRVRLGKKGASILRAKPRVKSIRLGIKVSGSDGFTAEKAKNVKLG